MNPEERDRLARLEEKVKGMDQWLREMDGKLDTLVAAANMGKGAGWALIRVGGLMVMGIGSLAWLYDHLPFHK